MDETVIVVQNNSPQNRHSMIINFLRAVERFRFAHGKNKPGGDNIRQEALGWAALAEALSWVYSIIEDAKDVNRKDPGKIKYSDEELVAAFESARGITQHKGWQGIATEISHGDKGQTNSWIWGDRPDNERSGSKDDPANKAYEKRLRGRDILDSLDQLGKVFFENRGWEITREAISQPGYEVQSEIEFDTPKG